MERMQSTWENVVDYDMSESGVRPLTLREIVGMGLDLDEFLEEPLGYSQSNGTIELRERIAALYPGASIDNVEVTNGTSEANYLLALSLLGAGDVMAMEAPNYMQMPGVARSVGASVRTFRLRQDTGWEPDGRFVGRFRGAEHTVEPTAPRARCCPTAMARIVSRCGRRGRGFGRRGTSAPRSIGRGPEASGA